jgi:hypothetical protein
MGRIDAMAALSKKLVILAYKDPSFSDMHYVDQIKLQVNPDNIIHDHEVTIYDNDFDRHGIDGRPGQQGQYKGRHPESLRFDFMLDGTGVIKGDKDINETIEKFKKLTYQYHGNLHGPYYLQIIWGKLLKHRSTPFRCRLERLDINYTLFKSNGKPLRARIDCAFKEFISEDDAAKKARLSSPDLSHVRIVRAGDTLPLLCYEIYGSAAYYPTVARLNGLTNVHRLEPGTRLLFPPLER